MRALVVDDDAVVRGLVCRILTTAGHEVIEAQDGFAALELAGQHQCDVVITDFVMPGMNGRELVARLKSRGYSAVYLLISGALEEQGFSELPFLAKPFTPAQLLGAIEKLSAEGPQSGEDLEKQVRQAKAQWLAAMAELDAIVAEMPSGIPYPDSSLRIQKAGERRAAAFDKYRTAWELYQEALRRSPVDSSNDPSAEEPEGKQ
jgi:CheY-like chemotaxis protein